MTADGTPDRDVAEVLAVMLAHQRIPLFDGTQGQRCVGCDDLRGATDGPNSPRHMAHVAAALAPLIAVRERAAAEHALREAADLADRVIHDWSKVPGLHPTEPEPHPAALRAAGARRTLEVLRHRMSDTFRIHADALRDQP